MDRITPFEQEDIALAEQLQVAQTEVSESQNVFLQIEEFSSRLGITVEIKETYRNCLELFQDLFHLDFASLFLKDTSKNSMRLQDTLGFPESLINHFLIEKGVGLPGLVLETWQVETVNDFSLEKRICIPDIVIQQNINSAIAVPMLHDNALFGIIVGHTKKRTIFSKKEQIVSQIFANQSATAIRNAIHIRSLKLSDKALLERSNELQSIFENSMAGIILLKGDRRISRCNQRLVDFMGYDSPKELTGMSMQIFHLSEKRYKEVEESTNATLSTGKPVRFDYQLRKKDGSTIWCEISGKTLDKTSSPDLKKGVVYIINDISQRKKMEEQLLKGRKLESLAILTGGLGHDFNNIITAILGNIDLCLATTEPDHKSYAFLQPAKEATLRVKDLTQRLQMLSQPSKPVLSSASLSKIIEETAHEKLHNGIDLTFHFAKNLHKAQMDAEQIAKAIGYLLSNSVRAMAENGRIHISCNNFSNQDDTQELRKGEYVQTSIHDNGHGIAPEIFGQIFDPYFTTRGRSQEKGSGLGLATVLSIMKRHKGFITADSNIDEGATFTFYLPAAKETAAKETLVRNDATLSAGGKSKGKILLMDDDETVRRVTQQMLTLIGYEVDDVADGESAIECYHSAMRIEAPFDLLIMDLHIPEGMGAIDATEAILELDSNAKIIIVSGDPMDTAMHKFKDFGFSASLAKPFEFKAFNKIIETLLKS